MRAVVERFCPGRAAGTRAKRWHAFICSFLQLCSHAFLQPLRRRGIATPLIGRPFAMISPPKWWPAGFCTV